MNYYKGVSMAIVPKAWQVNLSTNFVFGSSTSGGGANKTGI